MKDQILLLRANGLSYNEIVRQLGCSKSTVSYYCGVGQKEKSRMRTAKLRQTARGKLNKKVDAFKSKATVTKCRDFNRRCGTGNSMTKTSHNPFTLDELVEKIGTDPICYLTGRSINLTNPSEYHLDHIVPPRVRIDNSLSNCNVATKEANLAKSDLTLEEFIELCKEVCEKFGYRVT